MPESSHEPGMQVSINLQELVRGEYLTSQEWWCNLLVWTLAIVLQRSCTALLFAVSSRRSCLALRSVAAGTLVASAALLIAIGGSYPGELLYIMLGLVYFTGVALAAHWLATQSRALQLTPAAVFALAAFLTVLLPCLFARAGEANVIRLFGFELMLSIYSYVVDRTRATNQSSRADALFFLLVNPVLVLSERGTQFGEPRFRFAAAARIVAGAATIAGAVVVGQSYLVLDSEVRTQPLWVALVAANNIVALSMLHSGAASVQIGWMAMLGWRVPERYDWAILARSPLEFWQRWNTYLGAWLRSYVFMPIAMRWRRQNPRAPRPAMQSATILATFGACGLLHDFGNYPATFELSVSWTVAFILAGWAVILWLAASAAARSLQKRWGLGAMSGLGYAVPIVGVALTFLHVLMMAWVLRSPIAGRMNPVLSSTLGLDGLSL